MENCYACDTPATSREHVPPRCLFPEAKDTPSGQNYRRQLITVPSCDTHNTGKSGDDSYFRDVFVLDIRSNSIALQQAETKVARAIRRLPSYADILLEGAKDVRIIDSANGRRHGATSIILDAERFSRVLNLCALGIYCHHFGQRWVGRVVVSSENAADLEASAAQQADRIRVFRGFATLFSNVPKFGDNPDVFTYQILDANNRQGECAIRMTFYGGPSAVAVFSDGHSDEGSVSFAATGQPQ